MPLTVPPRYPPAFDPRQVPVLDGSASAGLQAAPPGRLTALGLREHFDRPPVWTPELVQERRFTDRPPAAAAVLIPLVKRQRLGLLLTQRSAHLSTHSGQIAFPGGKVDAADRDAIAAALREAQEEIGLAPSHVQVLGTLPQYVTGTQFFITPVVALVEPGFSLQPNPHEVEDVFEVPLDFLMDPANHRRHGFEWNGEMREWYSMPYQDGATERFIWGATAGMLRNLYRFLMA
jgi:8-oxo-dGTP pyrophosphatase MutT (NUDIX family)